MSEWQDGGRAARTERFRHALALAENGQPEEAVLGLRELLDLPELGRRLRCKVHTVLARLLTPREAGRALQHAEEGLRLADMVADPWLRGEALSQVAELALAHGDLAKARRAAEELQHLLVRQPGALSGGGAQAFWLLGRVLRASGEWTAAGAALAQAEAMVETADSPVRWEIRAERAALLLEAGKLAEARSLLVWVTQATAPEPTPRAIELAAVEAVLANDPQAEAWLQRALTAAGPDQAVRARVLAWWARHRPDEQGWALRALSEAAMTGRWDVLADVQAILRVTRPA
jgi:tetratricopeptide (TPR) repeat protein